MSASSLSEPFERIGPRSILAELSQPKMGFGMDDHEYTILGGGNRSRIGRYIAIASAATSSVLVTALLSLVDVAQQLGISINLPPSVLSLVGAGMIYAALYLLFDRFLWRWRVVGNWLRLSNLNGRWACTGKSLNPDKSLREEWIGEVTIRQSWDKMRVRLKTKKSTAISLSAALKWDKDDGTILMYSYRNEPNPGELDLLPHTGYAELTFSNDAGAANGLYFNGFNRLTSGTFTVTRHQSDDARGER